MHGDKLCLVHGVDTYVGIYLVGTVHVGRCARRKFGPEITRANHKVCTYL